MESIESIKKTLEEFAGDPRLEVLMEDPRMERFLSSQGIGNAPNEAGSNYNDCHFWLEDADGKIIDPTPPAKEGERRYKKFSLRKQKELYKIWNMRLKARGKANIRKEFSKPLDRCCQFNVYAYWYCHKELKVCIGSLGFKRKGKKIFWEFG